jgi:hypothetical protein
VDRLLRDTAGGLRLELRDKTGALVNADSLPTVTVYDSAGVAVAAGVGGVSNISTGLYELAVLPALTATMDIYEIRWAATISGAAMTFRTYFDVVGGFIVSEGDVRAFDPDLTVANGYTSEKVASAREWAEERFERLCRRAFRPRGRREILSGSGLDVLTVDALDVYRVVAGSINAGSGAVALSGGEITDLLYEGSGVLRRRSLGVWSFGYQNVSLLYEYGSSYPPEEARDAVLRLLRSRLVRSAVPERALSLSTNEGTYRISTAGRDGPTGLPEVDAAIETLRYAVPAVG